MENLFEGQLNLIEAMNLLINKMENSDICDKTDSNYVGSLCQNDFNSEMESNESVEFNKKVVKFLKEEFKDHPVYEVYISEYLEFKDGKFSLSEKRNLKGGAISAIGSVDVDVDAVAVKCFSQLDTAQTMLRGITDRRVKADERIESLMIEAMDPETDDARRDQLLRTVPMFERIRNQLVADEQQALAMAETFRQKKDEIEMVRQGNEAVISHHNREQYWHFTKEFCNAAMKQVYTFIAGSFSWAILYVFESLVFVIYNTATSILLGVCMAIVGVFTTIINGVTYAGAQGATRWMPGFIADVAGISGTNLSAVDIVNSVVAELRNTTEGIAASTGAEEAADAMRQSIWGMWLIAFIVLFLISMLFAHFVRILSSADNMQISPWGGLSLDRMPGTMAPPPVAQQLTTGPAPAPAITDATDAPPAPAISPAPDAPAIADTPDATDATATDATATDATDVTHPSVDGGYRSRTKKRSRKKHRRKTKKGGRKSRRKSKKRKSKRRKRTKRKR